MFIVDITVCTFKVCWFDMKLNRYVDQFLKHSLLYNDIELILKWSLKVCISRYKLQVLSLVSSDVFRT